MVMKKLLVCVLPALALLSFSSLAARADQFDRIETSADTYWVPAPTPPPTYASAAPGLTIMARRLPVIITRRRREWCSCPTSSSASIFISA
jgi:hypothetical protein